jgi:hypothetical protein
MAEALHVTRLDVDTLPAEAPLEAEPTHPAITGIAAARQAVEQAGSKGPGRPGARHNIELIGGSAGPG